MPARTRQHTRPHHQCMHHSLVTKLSEETVELTPRRLVELGAQPAHTVTDTPAQTWPLPIQMHLTAACTTFATHLTRSLLRSLASAPRSLEMTNGRQPHRQAHFGKQDTCTHPTRLPAAYAWPSMAIDGDISRSTVLVDGIPPPLLVRDAPTERAASDPLMN
jgi:hypothetical protein